MKEIYVISYYDQARQKIMLFAGTKPGEQWTTDINEAKWISSAEVAATIASQMPSMNKTFCVSEFFVAPRLGTLAQKIPF